MARAAQALGWEVVVATRVNKHGHLIRAEGFRLVPLRLERANMQLWREALAIWELIRLYRRERPDIVHHVGLKPVVYGSLAAWISQVPATLNALAGLGFLFTSSSQWMAYVRTIATFILRILLSRPSCHLLVQNEDDRAFLLKSRIGKPRQVTIIPGSGVDTRHFVPIPEPGGVPVAALVARMLWDKGVGEAVEAARILHSRKVAVTIALVGSPDPANPNSIPEDQLQKWQSEGFVEWWGHRDDIIEVWRHAHIAVLPSYREGLPKSLLEAAACARSLVATDAPGCRALVQPGVNGLLVPVRDSVKLADAIQLLAESAVLRNELGQAARALTVEKYDNIHITKQIQQLYLKLVASKSKAINDPAHLRTRPPSSERRGCPCAAPDDLAARRAGRAGRRH